MPGKKAKAGKLQKRLGLLATRFTDFPVRTKLSGQDFARMEEAGAVKLDADRRTRIASSSRQHFEFFRRLERQDYGSVFRSTLRVLQANLDEVAAIAGAIDSLPGHLWSEPLSDHAEVNAENELYRLKAIAGQLAGLNGSIDKARKRRSPDPFLPRLLEGLEREFMAAGGGSTGISRGTKKRGGRFLQFAEAAISNLPPDLRPNTSMGARWDRILRERRTPERPKSEGKSIWVGLSHTRGW